MIKIYRQGDILIKETENIPERRWRKLNNIVAEGKAGGHRHELVVHDIRIFEERGRIYIDLDSPTDLVHPEHRTVRLPPGQYILAVEREYDPFLEDMLEAID